MKADDDAKGIEIFSYEDLKDMNLAFDHKQILEDIFNSLN